MQPIKKSQNKVNLTELKGEIEDPTIIVVDSNTLRDGCNNNKKSVVT